MVQSPSKSGSQDDLPGCPIPLTHRRLRQAHRLWHQTLDCYHDAERFRANKRTRAGDAHLSPRGGMPGHRARRRSAQVRLASSWKRISPVSYRIHDFSLYACGYHEILRILVTRIAHPVKFAGVHKGSGSWSDHCCFALDCHCEIALHHQK
jgi:hypothetical protein